MDVLAVISLIEAGIAGVDGLTKVLKTVQQGGDPTPEQLAFVKAEQAAAQARFDVAINAKLEE
jgi:hypothetical protein